MRTMVAARKHDRSFARSETEIAGAIEHAGSDPQAVAFGVAEVTARDLRRADRSGTALLSAISALGFAAAQAAAQTGGAMGCVAQGFLFGVMLASMTKERRLLAVIGHAAGTFVKHVHEAGGDAAAAGRGLVEGAVTWADELDMGAGAAADAAGRGAVEAADDVDPELGRRVRAALERPILGFQVHLIEPAEAALAERGAP